MYVACSMYKYDWLQRTTSERHILARDRLRRSFMKKQAVHMMLVADEWITIIHHQQSLPNDAAK